MKKQSLLSLILAVLMVITSLGTTVFADEPVKVNVDDKALNMDTQPQIIDGRTMVPLRSILEALGLELKWDAETKTVTASNKDYNIVLPVGSKTAIVNGQAVQLEVPAQISPSGRTMVPARFIAESAGADVKWEPTNKTVNITSADYSRKVNNTTNINNVTGSTININNNNVDNSVNNSNNTFNNYDYSTKINNNITTNTSISTIGNMEDILKQVGMQDILKNSAQIEIQYTIIDKADNKPIKDAAVLVNGTGAGISNAEGVATFRVYGSASSLIKVGKQGYKDYQATKSYTAAAQETIILEAGSGQIVKLADANLEKAVRDALGKPTGELTESDFVKIEGLYAQGMGINNLEGIQNLTSLVDLNLSDNAIADLKPLSGMKNLKHLSVDNNKVTDLSPLSGLTSLEELASGLNNVTDLKPLEKLTGLKILHLWRTNVSDISVLSKLTNLTGLNLDGSKVTDIKALEGLGNLNWLRIMVDAPVSISPVKNIKTLKNLGFDMHKAPDWDLMFSMTQLDHLALKDITNDDLNKISYLNTRLKGLELDSSKLTNYMMLQNFYTLDEFSIKDTAINNNFSFLAAFRNLTKLDLSGNSISDVSFLGSVPNLTTLKLENNNIIDVTPIGKLSKLTWLSLKNNKITDVSVISKLTGLDSLFLYNNQIKDYSSLAQIYGNLKQKDFNVK